MLINSNYKKLFYGVLFSRIGDSLFTFVISWYILKETGSGFSYNLYTAVGLATFSISAIFIGGLVADRYAKPKILFLSDFTRGILLPIFFFVKVEIYTIYFFTVFINFFNGLFTPAYQAIIPEIVEGDEDINRANLFNSMLFNVTNILGVALGGFLAETIDIRYIFLISSLGYFATSFLELSITTPFKDEKGQEVSPKDNIEKIGYFQTFNTFKHLFIFAILTSVVSTFFFNSTAFLFSEIFKTSAIHLSLTGILSSALGVIMLLVFAKKKINISLSKATVLSVGVAVFYNLYLNLVGSFYIYYIFYVAFGLVSTIVYTSFTNLTMRIVHSEVRGRFFALKESLASISGPIIMILNGLLLDYDYRLSQFLLIVGSFLCFLPLVMVERIRTLKPKVESI